MKRKSIDIEKKDFKTLQLLSIEREMSLKKYIEKIIIEHLKKINQNGKAIHST